MAKPGDVVEFRSGLHGIEAPQNLGILLSRERRKGTPWVRLVTVDGAKDIKAEHLSRRAFKQRFDGQIQDESAVQARLHQLLRQHVDGQLAEESEDDLGRLEEALWEAVCDEGGVWREDDLLATYYGEPSPQQRKDGLAALERCRRPGIGRFETVDKGDRWRPWTRDERTAMGTAWKRLGDLRARLVVTEETDEGRAFVRVPWQEAGLTPEDQETLAWAKRAMVQFVENDGVPAGEGRTTDGGFHNGVHGIGGLGATKAFGMDLHRQLGFLAQDWIRSEATTRSSDYVHFLLESGLWSPEDAVVGLMRRHVNQEPFFEHVPDADAEALAQELPEPRFEDDPGRTDLRHLACYTIDPPDAKDFDDAVGIETTDAGTRLWIHIADVSHYVRPGTRLDRHAKQRATSVYLPGRVLPMLPARIADHLCSLRDDGDRFALSISLEIDPGGRVVGASFYRSIIRVTENLAYDEALRRAEAGQSPFADLLALAGRMRTQRSGLALETGEMKVLVGAEGFEALEKRANPATQMIEAFMVAANEAVAKHLSDEGLGVLYRCHPLPDGDKATRFSHQLETMGLDVPFELPTTVAAKKDEGQSLLDSLKAGGGKMQLFGGGMGLGMSGPTTDDDPDDADESGETSGFATLSREEREAWLAPFRDVVDALADHADRELADVATLKLLGCMGRAFYTPDNEGHFGLASTHYCHFTSPIRRYPDLVVHRNLAWWIEGKQGDMPHPHEELQTLCDHCSDQERAAAALERRIKNSAMVLASLHGDKAFDDASARVTGITPASVFVQFGGLDARAAARDLPGGPYQVDEWESMLYLSDLEAPRRFDPESLKALATWYDDDLGETRRVRARLGEKVQVRLAGRNVADGKTDARITSW